MPEQGQAAEGSAHATARAAGAPRRAERDEARNGRALAEPLLVSLLRQLLPGEQPVDLFSLGRRQLDLYALNPILARHRLRLHGRPSASARQIKTRVGERHWERRSPFWLESLPGGEHAVPVLARPEPRQG